MCERPGGYGANHRRVRRQEEIIWIREQGFTCVVTLIPSPHNLHNYDELGVAWKHLPFGPHDDRAGRRQHALPGAGRRCWPRDGKVLVHQDELSDRVAGSHGGLPAVGRGGAPRAAGDLGRRAAAVPPDGPARPRPRRARRHRSRTEPDDGCVGRDRAARPPAVRGRRRAAPRAASSPSPSSSTSTSRSTSPRREPATRSATRSTTARCAPSPRAPWPTRPSPSSRHSPSGWPPTSWPATSASLR